MDPRIMPLGTKLLSDLKKHEKGLNKSTIYLIFMAEFFQELENNSCSTNINLSTVEDQVRLHLAATNTGRNTDEEMVPLAAQASYGRV